MKLDTNTRKAIWISLYTLMVAIILSFWWVATRQYLDTPGIGFTAAGRLAGLLGTNFVLWQLLMMSRLTPLERAFGLDRLARLHRLNGYMALILLLVHAPLLAIGYAQTLKTNVVKQYLDFVFNYADVWKAVIGLGMLVLIVGISITIVRRRLKYETWYFVHIFTYAAILLAFGHQFSVGDNFAGHPYVRAYWYAFYAFAFGSILIFRFGKPAWLYNRHRFRVSRVVEEAKGVVSVYVEGRHMERLTYNAGQFVIWRFLSRELWWQAHPFTISTASNGKYLRVTVKGIGDYSSLLANVKPGTPVIVDGPHGVFTTASASRSKLLFIAGGIGITPIRAMLEGLGRTKTDVTVLYACRTAADIALRSEIDALAKTTGAKIEYLLSDESVPGTVFGRADRDTIAKLVPDAKNREVFLCGPPPMMNGVTITLVSLGVKPNLIHTERFGY